MLPNDLVLLVPEFEPKPDHDLDRRSDEELIAYIRAAHDADAVDAAVCGLSILVFGHWPNVARRVRMKIPSEHVEDVTSIVIVSAIGSTFSGASVGEFVKWLATITQRRIADFHRKAEKQPDFVSLDAAADDEEGPGIQLESLSEEGYAEIQDVIEQILSGLSDRDREVIELRVFQDLPSARVADRLGLTVANVDQIASRFRRKLRKALGDDGDTSS